jgi:hypothetical protein
MRRAESSGACANPFLRTVSDRPQNVFFGIEDLRNP